MSVTSILAAVVLIAVLVFVHELGHFLAAKATGVRVTVFSIGFGQRVFGFKRNGTDYRLSALPFGGYVQMAGADPFGYADEGDELEDPAQSFQNKPVWQRLVVLAAGPAFNLILPLVVFTVLLVAGQPQLAPVVGSVDVGSPAAAAGIAPGDRVVKVAGQPVTTWMDVEALLAKAPLGTVNLSLERGGASHDATLPVDSAGAALGAGFRHEKLDASVGVSDPASPAGRAGLKTGDVVLRINDQPVADWTQVDAALASAGDRVALAVRRGEEELPLTMTMAPWTPVDPILGAGPSGRWGMETASLYIGSVGATVDKGDDDLLGGLRPDAEPASPAALAGLQAGDRFLRMGDQPVLCWSDVLDAVRGTMVGEGDAAVATPIQASVVRAGQVVTLTLTPAVIRDTYPTGQYYFRPILGVIRLGGLVEGEMVRIYYPLPKAIQQATVETTATGTFILAHIGKLLTGEAAVKKSLGGPVEMFRQAGNAAERGLFDWARLLGMLSISLGIVNLLPVPVLDGGQILFHAVEGIRGRPLSLAIRERVQQIGLLFLVLLMLSVLVFDIQRIFEGPG